jgi:mono/diheme cytochrome c family protein
MAIDPRIPLQKHSKGPGRRPDAPGGARPGDAAPRSRRGRPRLTPEELRGRLIAYCKRHGVGLNDEGLPPFPAGQRETEQHREWMSLYKAHRRLAERRPTTADVARRQELLILQQGRCAVCHKALEIADSRLDDADAIDGNPRHAAAAVLHAPCRQLVDLARSLGAEALERAKARL